MKRISSLLLLALAPVVMTFGPAAWGQNAPTTNPPAAPPPFALADFAAPGIEGRFKPSYGADSQVSAVRSADPAAPGAIVTIAPGPAGYPGSSLKPEGGAGAGWDLSKFGHIEAKVVNTGTTSFAMGVRVDNDGDWRNNPFNCESLSLKPGTSGTVSVIFGYSYGKKPGFKLDPAKVVGVLFYVGKAAGEQSFRVEWVRAAGSAGEKPPVDPASVRIVPKDGFLLGGGVEVDAAKQIEVNNKAEASLDGQGLKIAFSGKEQVVSIRPPMGCWDLRKALEVHVKVRNTGSTPANPRVKVGSSSGSTAEAGLASPLAPGAQGEIVATFLAPKPWEGIKDSYKTSWNGQPGTGTSFISDAVSAVHIKSGVDGGAQSLLVESIKATPPAPAELPDWLGKRPPVEGDWVKTFEDEFNGDKIDESKWRIYGGNPWDKCSHFSKDNIILGGGFCKLHYEKKTGFHCDDPTKKQTDFATGFLSTYGKWTQCYGYFESRMKLTKGPGMWPAFWLMPDRGISAGPQWVRADTGRGGMEFDIMEFLGRWGQYRYNIAMHWDGYEKSHQQMGSTKVYFTPDKDGFVTAGLLWTPNMAIYYANGKEVLRWESPRISTIQSYIIYTNVTGGWENDAFDEKQMPDDFVIDYVRVWQRKDLASPEDGSKPPEPPSAAAQQ